MTWSNYGGYVAFAVVVIVVPGPDFALVVKNCLFAGRRGGLATSLGITASNLLQGTAAAFGLSALIVRSQVAFTALRWAGVVYLAWLGVQALRSGLRGHYPDMPGHQAGETSPARGLLRARQGFLSNITNPKVLTLYLTILPQFLDRDSVSSTADALTLAYTHAALGLVWLLVLVVFLHRVRDWLRRRALRRALDAATGCALLGFSATLATEAH